MSYLSYKAAAAQTKAARAKYERELQQAEANLRATLPFLGDDIFVLLAADLDVRMHGRLACTAPRFWRGSVPDPEHKKGAGAPELWSVAEEGARRRLRAQSEQVRGWFRRPVGGSWLRALGEVQRLQRPLRFTDREAPSRRSPPAWATKARCAAGTRCATAGTTPSSPSMRRQ